MKKVAMFIGVATALGMTACAPPAEEENQVDETMMTDEEPIVDERTDEGDDPEGDDPNGDDRTGPDDRSVPEPMAPTGTDDRRASE